MREEGGRREQGGETGNGGRGGGGGVSGLEVGAGFGLLLSGRGGGGGGLLVEEGALLAGDEDATGIMRVVAAVSLVDIGALDRASGEPLGVCDDVAEGVTVVRVVRQRPGMQHELPAGGGDCWS